MNGREKSDKWNNDHNKNDEVPVYEQHSLTVTCEHSAGSSQSPICRHERSPLSLQPVCFVAIHPPLKQWRVAGRDCYHPIPFFPGPKQPLQMRMEGVKENTTESKPRL